MTDAPVIALARELVRRPSVTPDDGGCQALLADRLAACGFASEHLRFGDVDNLWARRGDARPLLCLAGHTDVVPTGPEADWSAPPFGAEIRDGVLIGRGIADMKGALAAMVTAVEQFVAAHPQHGGGLAMLLTSDEEGIARDGTRRVIEVLAQRDSLPDYCLLGEPSSGATPGDRIRVGRRGSLSGTLQVLGRQGHVAFPELADNPVHRALPALGELCREPWDKGFETFPPTSFQISNVRAGTGASNVIPGQLEVEFNLRYSPALSERAIRRRCEALLAAQGLRFNIDWHLSGEPFYSAPGPLREAVLKVTAAANGRAAETSTGGGTSDGRFIAPAGIETIELGVSNSTIHQVDEQLPVADLVRLETLYLGVLRELLL